MTAVRDLGGRTRLSSDGGPSWPFGVRDRLAAGAARCGAAGAAGLLVMSERLARRGWPAGTASPTISMSDLQLVVLAAMGHRAGGIP